MLTDLDIMYRPELENLTSLMLEMISLKKDLFIGSSGSSNILVWLSQRADWNKININRKYRKRKEMVDLLRKDHDVVFTEVDQRWR